MSTRSLICEKIGDDQYKTIYCHSDGYLTYNGAMLIDHYSDRKKVEELLALGNISQLNENLYPDPNYEHTFDDRQENVVVAYGRDRGEQNEEARILPLSELTREDSWIEYVYVFDENDKWQYMELLGEQNEFRPVEEGLAEEYKAMGVKRPPNCYGYPTDEYLKELKKKQEQDEM